jgi:hypothetical protein
MKKLLFLIATTLITTTASAQSAFEGFYGQIGVGYENNSPSTSSYAYNSSNDGSSLPVSTSDSSKGSFSGAIGLGYGFSINNNFLLSLGADYSPLKANTGKTTDEAGFNYNYQIANRTNIFLAPGYVIDKDKLAYFKAGYSQQTMKMQNYLTPNGTAFGNGGSNPSNTLRGYVLGLGYKQLISQNIYMFGEGNYYSYGNQSYTSVYGSGLSDTFNAKATAYQFLVGVGYKF